MKKNKKKHVGYARVSTKEQKEDRQIAALLEAGVPKGQIFVDKVSGKDFERPQYQEMLDGLDADTVLFVKSVDRLGRNYKELMEEWRVITKEKGADIVVLDMPILDTRAEQNLTGKVISDIVLTLLSFVAENERENIRSRQAEGIREAKKRGVRFGHPRLPLPPKFEEAYGKWERGELSIGKAAAFCGMHKSSFYRRIKEREKPGEQ